MVLDSTVNQVLQSWLGDLGDEYISSAINTVLYGCAFVAAILKWNNLKKTQAPLGEQFLWLCLIFILLAIAGQTD